MSDPPYPQRVEYKGFSIEVRKSEKGYWLARGTDANGEEAFPTPVSGRDPDAAIDGVKLLIDRTVYLREKESGKKPPESEWHSPDA